VQAFGFATWGMIPAATEWSHEERVNDRHRDARGAASLRRSLVMWDNRCLLHRAERNYDMTRHRRILHRTVVKGTVPF